MPDMGRIFNITLAARSTGVQYRPDLTPLSGKSYDRIMKAKWSLILSVVLAVTHVGFLEAQQRKADFPSIDRSIQVEESSGRPTIVVIDTKSGTNLRSIELETTPVFTSTIPLFHDGETKFAIVLQRGRIYVYDVLEDALSGPIAPFRGEDYDAIDAQSGNLVNLALSSKGLYLEGTIMDYRGFVLDLRPYVNSGSASRGHDRDIAAELNAKGFRLYEQKKYDVALGYFKLSAARDNSYHYAYYNYACTAALLLSRNYCMYTYLIDDIYMMLEYTVELKPEYKEKMMRDSDLDSVKNTYSFITIAGYDPTNGEDVETILTSITWYGPKPGVFPADPKVTFNTDYSVEIGFFCIAGEGDPGYEYIFGTYEVEGTNITIHLGKPISGRSTISAQLRYGKLFFSDDVLPILTDFDDPCSA